MGILGGFKEESIYYVYVPTRKGSNKIVRLSNVRFNENRVISKLELDFNILGIDRISYESRGKKENTSD